ncbi:hypothetical protein L1857_08725 [Amycolatopsis thermalba]|uniref:Uncharacterized protein n=1 Tax=Amycolatopsis thermalba TaxID=944492 RepID=A0ABY4NS61_9PSEU|nr:MULTISPECIES: hypothetical protein [Amycolatopsis]UQS22895.1 hypothetical protein L1857_08725 [Amycolatopsis thermalba]
MVTNRVLAEHAEAAGFGRLVRVHRTFREPVAGAMLGVLGLVPAGIAAFYLVLNDSTAWRWIVLGYAALLWATAAWTWWGPVPGGRCWFGAAERGLVVWVPGAEPEALRWEQVEVAEGLRLVWNTGSRPIGRVWARDELVRTVRSGRPYPPRRTPRLAAGALAVALSGLVVWFTAVPLALELAFGERPREITDLARLCTGGEAFGQAPAYSGPGPHAVAVYEGSGFPDYLQGFTSAEAWPPPADEVQLVGCSRLIGQAAPAAIRSCEYEDGSTRVTYQGRYAVTVVEARTGRPVAEFTVDGAPTVDDCQLTIVVPSGNRGVKHTSYTTPDDAAFAAHLTPLVDAG